MSDGCMLCGHGLLPQQYRKFELIRPLFTQRTPRQYCSCANGRKLTKVRKLTNLLTGKKDSRMDRNIPVQSYSTPMKANEMKQYFGDHNGNSTP